MEGGDGVVDGERTERAEQGKGRGGSWKGGSWSLLHSPGNLKHRTDWDVYW